MLGSNIPFCTSVQLTARYQVLDEKTMDFVLSLTPLFEKYASVSPPYVPDIFPKGNVLVSQVCHR